MPAATLSGRGKGGCKPIAQGEAVGAQQRRAAGSPHRVGDALGKGVAVVRREARACCQGGEQAQLRPALQPQGLEGGGLRVGGGL